jgi:hypothetical protein
MLWTKVISIVHCYIISGKLYVRIVKLYRMITLIMFIIDGYHRKLIIKNLDIDMLFEIWALYNPRWKTHENSLDSLTHSHTHTHIYTHIYIYNYI